ncbi:unnamed protein product, partial [Prorocentrum cordatum]
CHKTHSGLTRCRCPLPASRPLQLRRRQRRAVPDGPPAPRHDPGAPPPPGASSTASGNGGQRGSGPDRPRRRRRGAAFKAEATPEMTQDIKDLRLIVRELNGGIITTVKVDDADPLTDAIEKNRNHDLREAIHLMDQMDTHQLDSRYKSGQIMIRFNCRGMRAHQAIMNVTHNAQKTARAGLAPAGSVEDESPLYVGALMEDS